MGDRIAAICAVVAAAATPATAKTPQVAGLIHFLPALISDEDDRVYIKSIVLAAVYLAVNIRFTSLNKYIPHAYLCADASYFVWFVSETGRISFAAATPFALSSAFALSSLAVRFLKT
tara:strand:+ start:3722 stop:4075 length:354 start_codon:yes stop_codon:yes gene_type:complete